EFPCSHGCRPRCASTSRPLSVPARTSPRPTLPSWGNPTSTSTFCSRASRRSSGSGATIRTEERPVVARKGRGAVGNREGRFETRHVRPMDYGWSAGDEEDTPPALPTTVTPEKTRTILSQNDSPDVPFDRPINPYKGSEPGCVYCFARPTHSYLGLSPGLDFETKIFSKPAAARLLRSELRRPGYRCEVIALGANTDPYQPVERDLGI